MRTILIWLAVLAASLGSATAADLKLLASNGFRPVAQDMLPIFERATGHKVRIETNTDSTLARRIAAGETFDVAVLPHQALERMVGANRIIDDSLTPLARAGIGVAVGLGALPPDLSSVESFRRALLAARSIAYADPISGGMGGITMNHLFQVLGVGAEVRAKSVMVVGGLAAQSVARGQAEVALEQASDILAVPGVRFAGLLPASLQSYTVYSGAIGAGTRNEDAAALLLEALARADESAVLRRRGMEVP
jgi:molybdate transport system substrate-binding protein